MLHPEQGFEFNRFIIRSVYLAIVAALLLQIGLYLATAPGENRLSWPPGRPAARTISRTSSEGSSSEPRR